MYKYRCVLIACLFSLSGYGQQDARFKEFLKTYKTYPFSDPDPIPATQKIYPYFRFDGFTDQAVDKEWRVVLLENDYIEVQILPEIGGKVWTAIDKQSGQPFLYDNDVVKFRDIAMRGPWVSGGIEANYGIIGHTPNTATPVDYLVKKHADGSVSCYTSTLDLLTRTRWVLEIRLEKDKAYFSTRSFWLNATGVERPYYTWMNAGIPAGDDLKFLYPGSHYIGHDGSAAPWPVDSLGRDLSYYRENAFHGSKSYHVLGSHSRYFGALWEDRDFGMIHYAPREDKLGKKIFLWAQSRSGGIWEDLLTDKAGQYVEVQSGRLFNQNQFASSATPFKQIGFAPYGSDRWTEYWYPFRDIDGFSAANLIGAFRIAQSAGILDIQLSPVQVLADSLQVLDDAGDLLATTFIQARPLEKVTRKIELPTGTQAARLTIKGEVLDISESLPGEALSRPVETWDEPTGDTAYGLYLQGRDLANFRDYAEAEKKISQALQKNKHLVPALTQMAQLKLFRMQYDSAFYYAHRALAVDTYDGAANYYYGRAAQALGKDADAMDGYEVASVTPYYRVAAYTALARMYVKRGDIHRAREYAVLSAENDPDNLEAWQIQYVLARKQNDKAICATAAQAILDRNPLSHFLRFEEYLQEPNDSKRETFTGLIRNEMPVETYLELSIWYADLGWYEESRQLLELGPKNAEVLAWLAWLYREDNTNRSREALERMEKASAHLVFPFRPESAQVFQWASGQTQDWKPNYFHALIHEYRGNRSEARMLLDKPAGEIDFAPFYVFRARVQDTESGRLADLKTAVERDPTQWRYGLFLARSLDRAHRGQEALNVLKSYRRQHPENYILGLDYVRLLLKESDYQTAESVLDQLHVLPFEGATDARNYYRQTKLMLAHQALEKKRFNVALEKVAEAEEWPEQLGVGRPYADLIDNRIEQAIKSRIYEATGKNQQASQALDALKGSKVTAENYLEAIKDLTRKQDQRLF